MAHCSQKAVHKASPLTIFGCSSTLADVLELFFFLASVGDVDDAIEGTAAGCLIPDLLHIVLTFKIQNGK